MVNVKEKWAFITGAARGIGALSAKFLAENGCNLILHARTKEHCAKILKEVKSLGIDAEVVTAELSDLAQVESMLKEIDNIMETKKAKIEFVLNNAGMQIAYRADYFETPVSDYTESFKINTIAPAMICYHFLPKMIQTGFGRVVNTTSGIRLEPQQAGYSASKAALDKITIDLGSKLQGTDVTINLADPGWCRTDLGGPNAPNSPESAIPGILVGAFIDDKKSGRTFGAQEFAGMTLQEAVAKAETYTSPY